MIIKDKLRLFNAWTDNLKIWWALNNETGLLEFKKKYSDFPEKGHSRSKLTDKLSVIIMSHKLWLIIYDIQKFGEWFTVNLILQDPTAKIDIDTISRKKMNFVYLQTGQFRNPVPHVGHTCITGWFRGLTVNRSPRGDAGQNVVHIFI